jgi:hypothetical protein
MGGAETQASQGSKVSVEDRRVVQEVGGVWTNARDLRDAAQSDRLGFLDNKPCCLPDRDQSAISM